MADYIQLTFTPVTPDESALLIAELSDIGYEGFEEATKHLKAFIPEAAFDPATADQLAVKYNVAYSKEVVKETNWNQVWESNFEPVRVDDFAGIRAGFHPPMTGVEFEIVITPQMSFGTGHHATTYMMVQRMQELDFIGKTVFDFGTGTGVLAILAEKKGAAKIIATDNDAWSISNARDNIAGNGCTRIDLQLSGVVPDAETYDVILANINKNIILQHIPAMLAQLKPGGTILFSGLLTEDEEGIRKGLESYGGSWRETKERDGWICLAFSR